MKMYAKIISDINNELFKKGLGSSFVFKRQGAFIPFVSNPLFDSLGGMELYVGEILRCGTIIGEWLVRKDAPFTEEEIREFETIKTYLNEEVFFEEWEHTYKFVQNRGCAYFPCHQLEDENSFNCLFCYCPLYFFSDCGGNFKILDNGIKDCSDCLLPHRKENYDKVIKKFSEGDCPLK